jgi:hypothetical protein
MNNERTCSRLNKNGMILGPSEHNPPKLEFQQEYVFDNKEVDILLPGAELSDIDSLKYFFDKYLFSVENGKPNQNVATILKAWIDVIQNKNRSL